METKVCAKCKEIKELSRFQTETKKIKNKYYTFTRNTCKNCKAKQVKKETQLARHKRYNKKRYKTDKYNSYRKQYESNRYHNDVQFRLTRLLRSRLRLALKNNSKKSKTLEYLGCSIDDFKKYLESKFTSDMTWNNQGSYWHIDHIKPLAKFNLCEESELKLACHYTNLQPLKAEDNLSKGAKYE